MRRFTKGNPNHQKLCDILSEWNTLSLGELNLNPLYRSARLIKKEKDVLQIDQNLMYFLDFHSQPSDVRIFHTFRSLKWRFWDFFPASKNPSYTWAVKSDCIFW